MSSFTREQCLQRLRAQVTAGRPIIGGGAGTGLSAKCAEAGGIDLIIIYNSGRFRMAGRGSLSGMMSYGDANQIVLDMAREGEFRHEDMLTKSAHTSWVGMRTRGAATHGIVRGTVVMRDGKVIGSPGYGQFTPGTAGRSTSTAN